MTLTEECKRYIAKYLGESPEPNKYCFTDTDATTVLVYTPKGEEYWGSTVDAVVTILDGGYSYEDKINKIGKIDADKLKEKNGGVALTDDDIVWIANHSNAPDKFCYVEVATPTPTPTPVPTTPTPTPTPTPPPPTPGPVWEPYPKEKCPPPPGSGYHCLTIYSDPPGAMIFIDGEDTYRLTPETFKIREGVYKIKLTKRGYADYETTVAVYADRTVKYALTRLTPTPPAPPIEIEVRKGEVKGYINVGESRIPRVITVGSVYTFRIRVENPTDGIRATYRVTLKFIGTGDVEGKEFSFTSDVSDPVDPGEGKSLYVDVLLPSTALADTSAIYILRAILEGWSAVVETGV